MSSKSLASLVGLSLLALEASAQMAFTPMLGINNTAGVPSRDQVRRPGGKAVCGAIPIAANLMNSSIVHMGPDLRFKVGALNFVNGTNGSREVALVEVDPTATGKNFVPARIVGKNGDPNPQGMRKETLVVELPKGTKCTGGAKKNRCLVQLANPAFFGGCVVVQQEKALARDVLAYGARAPRAAREAESESADGEEENGDEEDDDDDDEEDGGDEEDGEEDDEFEEPEEGLDELD